MNRLRRLLLLVAATVFSSPVAATTDLIGIYELARQHDASWQAAQATLLAERERVPQARAAILPNVSADAGASRNRQDATGSGTDSFTQTQIGVALTQSLYDRQRRLGIDLAQDQVTLAERVLDRAGEALILRVADRYFAVLAALDNVELAGAEKTAIARQLELAQERLEVGLGTVTDLYDAQARFQLAQAEELRALSALEDAREALAEINGGFSDELAPLQEVTPLDDPEPADANAWVDRALAGNTELELQRIEAELARQGIEIQRAGNQPRVDLQLSHRNVDNRSALPGAGGDRDSTSAGVQLVVPLWQGGRVASSTREAGFRYDAALKTLEATERNVRRSARTAYLDVVTAVRSVIALDQAVTASESALEARREGFEAGIFPNLDVLDAQRDLFRARRDYLGARYGYILSRLRLQEITGSLDEDDLRLVNTWLRHP